MRTSVRRGHSSEGAGRSWSRERGTEAGRGETDGAVALAREWGLRGISQGRTLLTPKINRCGGSEAPRSLPRGALLGGAWPAWFPSRLRFPDFSGP